MIALEKRVFGGGPESSGLINQAGGKEGVAKTLLCNRLTLKFARAGPLMQCQMENLFMEKLSGGVSPLAAGPIPPPRIA